MGLEAEATTVKEWQINIVPGLLQTERYARGILEGYREVTRIPTSAVDRRMETRMIRQQVLTRDQPLELETILDESVMRRQ